MHVIIILWLALKSDVLNTGSSMCNSYVDKWNFILICTVFPGHLTYLTTVCTFFDGCHKSPAWQLELATWRAVRHKRNEAGIFCLINNRYRWPEVKFYIDIVVLILKYLNLYLHLLWTVQTAALHVHTKWLKNGYSYHS